ncbi:Glycerophosphoryl diester phosphodiesterase family-domain-containing protein [Pyronema domesticum]|uniref:Similar to Glycerophosphodiester phosphodiesterase GDE1 acc. no. Q02979 n=1 Tax=Pyronema omphalodes (strain CBS 100304) TaxID=1076935 RepID=U4LFE6_PYROM|nr:Glycerophosphoryl diester phosphodiesterase family-domain-containing protein [Pyronema domesticum]CCX30608.1 Similar to Glycerophosphodiester phosphodiesterase GDE1; acc. no. Q02979 [Pyronema omphalodes CBS 100304]
MKFGKTLTRNQVPEWSTSYINYKGLKKEMKEAEKQKRAGDSPDLAPFLFALDRNIETVDTFFNKRLADANRRLKSLRSRYEDHFDLTPSSDNNTPAGSVKDEDFNSDNGKTDNGYGLDRDEMNEIMGALLELRSMLRKLQWYGELNRRGFIKILKKLDKKLEINVQRRYLETKVTPLAFASATDIMAMMQVVNLWLSKVGGTDGGLDPESARTADQVARPPYKRVSSGAAAGMTSEGVDTIDRCVREDNSQNLSEFLTSIEIGNVTPKLLLTLLQRCITNRSRKCVELLLGKLATLDEEDDINGRNIIHRMVISIGRAKGLMMSPQNDSFTETIPPASLSVSPRLFITPAEAPISAPPPSANTVECDGTLRLLPDDEAVQMLEYILSHLSSEQRGALAARDSYGRLPLHYAAQYGFVVLIKLLIKYMREWNQFNVTDGIDSADWQDADGYAPLHLAVIGEHPKTTRLLLQAESLDNEDGDGPTDKVIEARKHVSKSSAVLLLAARRNCVTIVELLVEAGVDVNYQDENGETALHHAARLGHTKCIQALLSGNGGQKPNVELAEKTYGWTPLFVAAVEGKQEAAEALIEVGDADIDKTDSSGWTAAEHAGLRGHLVLAKMLIEKRTQNPDKLNVTASSSPKLSSSPASDKNIPASALNGSLGPIGSTPSPAPQSVKSFGHRYLKGGQTMVLITLGSMDVRKDVQAVKLDQIPVSEAHTTQLDTALSLIVSANGASGEPTIVDLPVHENVTSDDPILFETRDINKVKIMFDIVPTYAGTKDKIIGRAVALLGAVRAVVGKNKASLQGGIQVPIMAINTLEVIGSVNFEFTIITPFEHPNIEISKEHTYWKSLTTPRVIGHRGLGKNFPARKSLQLGENTLLSFITAAKLGAAYVEFDVQLTKDYVPVIYHDFLVGETGIDAPVHTMTLEQFMSMNPAQNSRSGSPDRNTGSPPNEASADSKAAPTLRRARSMSLNEPEFRNGDNSERVRFSRAFKKNGFKGNSRGHSIQSPFATLEQTFKELPQDIGFNIELKYPTLQESEEEDMDAIVIEMNSWVDHILKVVYDHARERNIIFSSFNPDVCLMLSFKQPSIPILFLTEGGTRALGDIRTTSLQEAVRFANRWNLLGIVSDAEPLVMCPRLIRVVKESGLVCVTYGTLNNDKHNVKLQVEQGMDAIIVDHVLEIDKALRTAPEDRQVEVNEAVKSVV